MNFFLIKHFAETQGKLASKLPMSNKQRG